MSAPCSVCRGAGKVSHHLTVIDGRNPHEMVGAAYDAHMADDYEIDCDVCLGSGIELTFIKSGAYSPGRQALKEHRK